MRDLVRHDSGNSTSASSGPGPEQRTAPRVTLLIRTGKLITAFGEFLCVVRDASETGVNVRLFHSIPEGPGMLLEMPNGDRHNLDMVWQEQDRAGLHFHTPANLARLVEMPSRFAKRAVRVNCEAPAQIVTIAGEFPAKITNLSQNGAQIACGAHLAIDQRVRLKGEGLREVKATVRWRRDGLFGLAFEDTFQFGELARIVARLQLGKVAFESAG